MIRAEEYDYNEFLSDSSDDYPKYDEGLSKEQLDGVSEASFSVVEGMIRQSTGNPLAVKDADDWWDYKNSLGQDE